MPGRMLLCLFSILLVKITNVALQNSTQSVILENCPTGINVTRGYILAGTYATCKCQKIDPSNTSNIVWYQLLNKTAVPVIASGAADDQLLLQINTEKQDINTSLVYFCCIQDGECNYNEAIFYQPKIAYGPDPNSVMMNPEINSNWNFDLCPGMKNEATIVCDVDMTSVNPVPKLQFHVYKENLEEYIIFSDDFTVEDTFYRFTRKYNVTSPGMYGIKCNFSNAIFSNINGAVNHDIFVRQPPTSMPVLAVTVDGNNVILSNDNTANIVGNSHVGVTCSVSGGTPEVSSVSITCDKNKNTEKGTRVSLEFDVTQTVPITCTCDASHVTACYNYKSSLQIVAVYQATVDRFTANNMSVTIVVDSGSEISFVCLATGSPVPSMTLLTSDKTTLRRIEGIEIDETFNNVQCDFTNRYYCVAKNGLETNIELPQRHIDVYVNCLTRLKNPKNENMAIEVKVGQTVTIAIQVMGYPAPNTFLLTVPTSNVDIAVNQSKYSVSYQAEQNEVPTPYGTVILNVKDITKDDLITYNLFISNGGQSSFTFTLVEATTNDTLYIAIGVSLGILLIIIVTIIVAICYCRRKKQTQNDTNSHIYDTPYVEPYPSCTREDNIYDVLHKDSSDVMSNSGSYITIYTDVYDTISNGSKNSKHKNVQNAVFTISK